MEKAKIKQNPENSRQILATNMWAMYNFGDPNIRYQRFLSNGRPAFKSFIESILLYDSVVVPTQDFLSLTILLGVLGESTLLDLIHANSLKFLRVKGAFCYIGNGGGIKSYEIFSKPDNPSPFCAPLEEAVFWAIDGLSEKYKDPTLLKAVLNATSEVEMRVLYEVMRHETYMDILNSTYLRNLFAIRNKYMDRLAGIGPKQVRIYGGTDSDSWKGDEIDMVLLLASTNLELYLMNDAKCEDMITSNPIGHVLKAKAKRCNVDQANGEAFTFLQQITNVPDIGEGALTKQVDVKDLLKIKNSKNGTDFRKWFHSYCRGDTKSISKEYINLLKQVPKINSLPVRIMRFILTAGIGTIPMAGSLLGTAVSAVDSFFIERWLRGSSPKFFIEDLKQVLSPAKKH